MAWKYRFVIAACARWEAPYAAEWLSYHRAIGFEHVYLYCNDDDPAELYEAILPFTQGPEPFVTFRYFPEQGMQRKMLLHFCAHNGQDSEWVSFLDLDEFLRLPPGQTLPEYMRGFEDKTDCLMFNWVYCGPNGHKTPPESVLKGLTRRQPSVHPFTKMVFRSWILGQPELFRNAPDCSFLHRLHQYVAADIRPMNVLGEDMSGYYDDPHFNGLADEWAHDRKPLNRIFEANAFIHHYAFRTESAFTDRVARGLGGDFHGQDHWGRVAANEELRIGFTANINAVEDLALANVWDEIIAASARLGVTPVPDPPVPNAIMKWYFALSASSFGSDAHDWPSLIRASVISARANTGLKPFLLWDGPEHEFLNELRGLGVTVIFHKVSYYSALAEYRRNDPHGLATSAGCFLRTDIPLVEIEDAFVLYTDCDVMFLRDPVPMLANLRPVHFAACTEFTIDDGLNSGVLLLNIARMRADYPKFTTFITANLSLGLDQDMYRAFYADKWEKLPPELNWKPYWGRNTGATILHWHGIKPVLVQSMFADPAFTTHPDLMLLVRRNPEGYKHYLEYYAYFLRDRAEKPAPSGCAAVVLVVKNEVTDILAWLAWYRLLGFDAAIVYDDGSTDGTWEKLQQAAQFWDIRLHRTIGPQDVHYEFRQTKSYLHALAAYAGVFEWLGFFDADEFLQLSKHATVRDFLASFADADEVGINWCNYGSSGHILKPEIPAPLAYHWHSSVHTSVNRHVKCFVRPEKVGSGWVNVHCFDVPSGRAVLANGQRLEWSKTQGIIEGTPDWSVAKVMHYQCRSMEHFIERMKKRPELPATEALWRNYDFHDIEDTSPLSQAEALLAGIKALTASPGAKPPPLPDAPVFFIGGSDPVLIEEMLTTGQRVVAVEPDAKFYYTLAEQFAAPIAERRLVLENFAPAPRGGEIALLTPGDGGRPYHVVTISWEELVAKHGHPTHVHMGGEVPGFPALPG
ncbi:MAG: glycosyltransferase family 2 protein [Rhodospirillales bacterium]|nr:glycosyltransferase family 2 protein [Rhodospirillales bacterium]